LDKTIITNILEEVYKESLDSPKSPDSLNSLYVLEIADYNSDSGVIKIPYEKKELYMIFQYYN
jgi:hypothetical protein